MRTRRFYLILIAGVVLVGVFAFLGFREREPEYGGKRLSEWVKGYWAPPYTNYSAQTAEAKNAIGHIGTNALPYLLKWVGYERPFWKVKLYEIANSIMNRMNRSFHLNEEKEVRLARGAINAFIALGRNADGAIGELTQLRDTPRGQASAGRAAIILEGLNYPFGAAKPFLLTAIASELRPIYLDSPQSHPSFTFKVLDLLDLKVINESSSGPPVVKLDLDRGSSRYSVMTFFFTTNRSSNPPFSGPTLVKPLQTNALPNMDAPIWRKKSWY